MTSAPDFTILRSMILAEMPTCLIFQENKNHFYQLRRKNNLLLINLWIIEIDWVAFGKTAKGTFPRPAQPLNANINLRYAGIDTKLKFRAADSGKFRWSGNFSFPRNYIMNKKHKCTVQIQSCYRCYRYSGIRVVFFARIYGTQLFLSTVNDYLSHYFFPNL